MPPQSAVFVHVKREHDVALPDAPEVPEVPEVPEPPDVPELPDEAHAAPWVSAAPSPQLCVRPPTHALSPQGMVFASPLIDTRHEQSPEDPPPEEVSSLEEQAIAIPTRPATAASSPVSFCMAAA